MKNKKVCLDCGYSIDARASRCKKCANSGKFHPNWQGGWKSKLPHCLVCNKQLSRSTCIYCQKHAQIGKRHPNWKGGKHIASDGYIVIYMPNHPRAIKNYIYEHRLVMERHLGRYLTKEEVVHHKNENKIDNTIKNLKLFNNVNTHIKYHQQKRKLNNANHY